MWLSLLMEDQTQIIITEIIDDEQNQMPSMKIKSRNETKSMKRKNFLLNTDGFGFRVCVFVGGIILTPGLIFFLSVSASAVKYAPGPGTEVFAVLGDGVVWVRGRMTAPILLAPS